MASQNSKLLNPQNRVRGAWLLFWLSVVGWPLSALTFAKDEPPFILGLSWLAITLTALDIIATTDVRANNEEKK